MVKEKAPAIFFYVKDWLSAADLMACSDAAQGIWMRCLCYLQLSHDKTLPGDIESLGRVLGRPPEYLLPFIQELESNGVFSRTSTGRVFNRRLAKASKTILLRSQAGKKGGLKKAENQRAYKQNSSKTSSKTESKASPPSPDPYPILSTEGVRTTYQEESPPSFFEEKFRIPDSDFSRLSGIYTEPTVNYYIDVCRRNCKASGKAVDDFAAYVENWIVKDRSEERGLFKKKIPQQPVSQPTSGSVLPAYRPAPKPPVAAPLDFKSVPDETRKLLAKLKGEKITDDANAPEPQAGTPNPESTETRESFRDEHEEEIAPYS